MLSLVVNNPHVDELKFFLEELDCKCLLEQLVKIYMLRIKDRQDELKLEQFVNNDEEILDLSQHIYTLLVILKSNFPNSRHLSLFAIREKFTLKYLKQKER